MPPRRLRSISWTTDSALSRPGSPAVCAQRLDGGLRTVRATARGRPRPAPPRARRHRGCGGYAEDRVRSQCMAASPTGSGSAAGPGARRAARAAARRRSGRRRGRSAATPSVVPRIRIDQKCAGPPQPGMGDWKARARRAGRRAAGPSRSAARSRAGLGPASSSVTSASRPRPDRDIEPGEGRAPSGGGVPALVDQAERAPGSARPRRLASGSTQEATSKVLRRDRTAARPPPGRGVRVPRPVRAAMPGPCGCDGGGSGRRCGAARLRTGSGRPRGRGQEPGGGRAGKALEEPRLGLGQRLGAVATLARGWAAGASGDGVRRRGQRRRGS